MSPTSNPPEEYVLCPNCGKRVYEGERHWCPDVDDEPGDYDGGNEP